MYIPDYEWEDWFNELDSLRSGYDSLGGVSPYTGPMDFGGGFIRSAATVETILPSNSVLITMAGTPQAEALEHIRIFTNGTRELVAGVTANGDLSYDFNLSALQPGDYTLELEFQGQFIVSTTIYLEVAL